MFTAKEIAGLPLRKAPYFKPIRRGLSLGVRKQPQGDVFVVRQSIGGVERERTLGAISLAEALSLAETLGGYGPLTWEQATKLYLSTQRGKRSHDHTERFLASDVFAVFRKRDLTRLTQVMLEGWLQERAESLTLHGRESTPRARQESANRALTFLKAVLNFCYKRDLIPSDRAWRGVSKFKGTHCPRDRVLSQEEEALLKNACPAHVWRVIRFCLLTGLRWGELREARLTDIRQVAGGPQVATLRVPARKSAERYVPLTAEALELALGVSRAGSEAVLGEAGREAGGVVFAKASGLPWERSDQVAVMRTVCQRARIPHIGFHGLRHTFATRFLAAGGDLQTLSKILGHHSVKVTERHYIHLSPSWLSATALPTLEKL